MKDGLLRVRTFLIPTAILMRTIEFLREVGEGRHEGFVLWAGTLSDERSFRFTSMIVPEQRAMVTENGLLVAVDGDALFEVNKTVYARSEILAGQIHSHPTSAFHSSTDDAYPLATLVGALSVVVPDFARNAPRDMESWAWYRLSRKAKWEAATKNTRVEIE